MRVSWTPDSLRELADFVEQFVKPENLASKDLDFATKNPLPVFWYDKDGEEFEVGQIENTNGYVTFSVKVAR